MRNNRPIRESESGGSSDFDFRHHLFDTLILLGAKKEIADLVKKSNDFRVTDDDVLSLRNYNIRLLEETKRRLMSINTLKIATKGG